MAPDAKLARELFDLWRRDITGEVWDQISETERLAWLRVANRVLDVAYAVTLDYLACQSSSPATLTCPT
jgi:hypothetical protein